MKRMRLIAVLLAAAFAGVLLAAGCGVEQAREAGERAAGGEQQEQQEPSGSGTRDQNSTPESESPEPEPPETTSEETLEAETTAPDAPEASIAQPTTRAGEDTSPVDEEASGAGASGPTQVVESNETGVTFDAPASWELSFPSDGEVDPAGEPLEEFDLVAPDGEARILVQVYPLEEAIQDPGSPEVAEQLDQLYESLADELGGEMDYARSFERGSLSGREYLIVQEDGYSTRAFASIEDDRLYFIGLDTMNEADQEVHAPVLEEAVGSFEVLPM